MKNKQQRTEETGVVSVDGVQCGARHHGDDLGCVDHLEEGWQMPVTTSRFHAVLHDVPNPNVKSIQKRTTLTERQRPNAPNHAQAGT